jgi:hypothetical protein
LFVDRNVIAIQRNIRASGVGISLENGLGALRNGEDLT